MPIRPQFETEAEWIEHLRMWFAGQALPAVIAYALENPSRIAADETGNVGPEVCRLAYETADGMIKARKVQP
jgi:hypothetical protein